jgi:hypothetical protein
MNLSFTRKGKYIMALIKAVREITGLHTGGKIDVPGYEPATHLGPSLIEDGVRMHGFRLPDGTLLELESDRLTDEIEIAQEPATMAAEQ